MDDRSVPAALPARGSTRPRLLATAEGTQAHGYDTADALAGAGVALLWGSANFLIAEALDDFRPGLVTLLRVAIGFATLALVPASRHPVAREDWPRVALLGVTWIAVPFTLFPLAEQHIDSSLAGMLIGALPLFTAALAAALLRRLPPRRQVAGLLVGLGGVVVIAVPSLGRSGSTALGTVEVLVAVACYSVAVNLSVPLQQRYGPVPVLARAQRVATVLVVPLGLAHVPGSTVSAKAVASVVVLGVGASAVAFVLFGRVATRVGPTRAAIINYFVPVVAVFLGGVVRGETVERSALVGTALVVLGAWLVSGGVSRRQSDPAAAAVAAAGD